MLNRSSRGRPAPPRAPLERTTLHLSVLQLVCAAVFGLDLLLEFPDPRQGFSLSFAGTIHLLTEAAILVLLVLGFALSRRALAQLQTERDRSVRNLHSLRGEFDDILHARFDAWGLTAAQRDVALLTLRGLRSSDIAAARGSAEGTVKAHLSAVFRASSVRTRGELVGLFMEEFLDHGASRRR